MGGTNGVCCPDTGGSESYGNEGHVLPVLQKWFYVQLSLRQKYFFYPFFLNGC